MVFNGEIYNHKDLRLELESISNRNWLGPRILKLYYPIEEWGLEET